MAIRVERFGDVAQLWMTSPASRAAGLGVHAYALRGVMIDTGFHRARSAMAEFVEAEKVRVAIVTHYHEDHAGNVEMLARGGIQVAMRADTESLVRRPAPIQFYRFAVWGAQPVYSGSVSTQDHGLECIHTPGHSADHQVVFDRQTGTLFSGDLWLGIRARVLHTAEDPYVIVESLRRAAALAPDRMFDAHRGKVDKPVEALNAKAEWLTNTLGEVERRIAEGWSDRAIVRRVLGGEEIASYVSRTEYSRRNLVRAVRRRATG